MIALVLNIFGIIAAVLLSLFALVFVLFALVMLVPIRYECAGDLNGKSFSGSARVSWLFGIAAAALGPDQEITFRIMGIRVWRIDNNTDNKDYAAETPDTQADSSDNSADKPDSMRRKKRARLREPRAGHEKLTDKLASAWRSFEKLQDYPDKGEIVNQVVLLIKRTLKAALPEQLDIRGSFGFEDPCRTGIITGVICTAEPFISQRIRLSVMPDFSRKILELKTLVRGKISIISLVVPFCKFLLSKPIRKLAKIFLKLLKSKKPSSISSPPL